MKHLTRTLKVAIAVIVAAVPVIAADPAVRSLIANHPGIAAYLPLATGVVYALWRAYRDITTPATSSSPPPPAAPPPSRA